MKYKEFKPEWDSSVSEPETYRAKFKWGNPEFFSEPSEAMYIFIKERLNLSDEDFIMPWNLGEEKITFNKAKSLSDAVILEFEAMLGKINVKKDVVSRVSATYGKGVYDKFRMRNKIIENIPDVVLTPVNEEQITSIMKFCIANDIAIYPSGGRTNCIRSTECLCGGVCLDLMQNYNKIISFSEIDQSVTVMSGISGPQLEEFLNNIGDYFPDVTYRYTLSHMPQSFEFSTIGGWVMSRSKGNNTTKIGGIDNLILSARYITPRGIVDTARCSKLMPIPSIDEIFIGSNGNFGVLLSVTLKVTRYLLDGKKQFSYMLPNIDCATKFVKEVCQGGYGLPNSLLLCDPTRTDMIMRMYPSVEKSVIAPFVRELHENSRRCLVLGSINATKNYASMVKRFINRSATQFGGRSATGFIAKNWERALFNNAYTDDMLMDYGVITDRLDVCVLWSKADSTYMQIKSIIEQREHTLCMVNVNHITAHSCSLQFEFVAKYDSIDDYRDYIKYLNDEIHSLGIVTTVNYALEVDYNEHLDYFPDAQIGLITTIKNYLDPHNILRRKGSKAVESVKPQRKTSKSQKSVISKPIDAVETSILKKISIAAAGIAAIEVEANFNEAAADIMTVDTIVKAKPKRKKSVAKSEIAKPEVDAIAEEISSIAKEYPIDPVQEIEDSVATVIMPTEQLPKAKQSKKPKSSAKDKEALNAAKALKIEEALKQVVRSNNKSKAADKMAADSVIKAKPTKNTKSVAKDADSQSKHEKNEKIT